MCEYIHATVSTMSAICARPPCGEAVGGTRASALSIFWESILNQPARTDYSQVIRDLAFAAPCAAASSSMSFNAFWTCSCTEIDAFGVDLVRV